MIENIQIIISIILIVLILLQERSGGLSGIFGGQGGEFYQTRRGLERIMFISTIVLVAAFIALSLLNLVFKA
jgi:protein translocase SecG subunit